MTTQISISKMLNVASLIKVLAIMLIVSVAASVAEVMFGMSINIAFIGFVVLFVVANITFQILERLTPTEEAYKANVEELQETIENLQNELSEVGENTSELPKQISELTKGITLMQASKDNYKAKVSELEKQVSKIQAKHENDISKASEYVSKQEAKISKLEADISGMEAEYNTALSKVEAGYKQTISELQARLSKNKDLQSELAVANKQLEILEVNSKQASSMKFLGISLTEIKEKYPALLSFNAGNEDHKEQKNNFMRKVNGSAPKQKQD